MQYHIFCRVCKWRERESNVKCRLFQGAESLSQLRKLAQNYPTQETGGELGDIDEDDEVPGQ